MLDVIVFLVVIFLCSVSGLVLILATKSESIKNKGKILDGLLICSTCIAFFLVGLMFSFRLYIILGGILTVLNCPLVSVYWIAPIYNNPKRRIPKQIILGGLLFSIGITFPLMVIATISLYIFR